MKFFFGILGLLLGATAGGWFGAIVGLGLGVVLGTMLKGDTHDEDARDPADPPAMPAAATQPPRALEARVASLEREVASLRAEVERLTFTSPLAPSAPVAAPAPAKPPVAPPATQPAPMPSPVPVPAPRPAPSLASPIESAAPAVATVPASPAPQPASEAAAVAPAEPLALVPLAAEASLDTPALADAQADVWQPTRPPAQEPPRRAPPAPIEPAASLQERLPPALSRLIFGGNTIVKVGVLILFLGLAFLLRYAAERVTVPVELRYAGVALLGTALLALGWRLRERKDHYGLILQGAGIGVYYLTTLAALKVSHLLPPGLAFAFLFAVTVLSALLAVAQNAPWLAYVAAAEGFAAPVLVSTGSGNHIALFSYLAVLNLGIVLVAWFRAWRPLNVIGAVGTFTLAAAWADKHYSDAVYESTQAFLLLFFVMFTLIGVLFARRALALAPEPDHRGPLGRRASQALAAVGRVDSTLAFGVPLAAYGLQYLMVRPWEFGPAWAAVGFSAFYLLLGGSLLRGGPSRYSLLGEAYVIVSVIFGTLAIPLALEGEWTGATWAIEAAGMYWLGVRQQRRYARGFALLVLLGATVRIASALQLDLTPGTPLFVGSVMGLLLLAAGALAMLAVGHRAGLNQGDDWEAAGWAGQLWIGVAAIATIPWLLLTPAWASVATSGIALACALLRWRAGLPSLQAVAGALHAVALIGFASTLHTIGDSSMLHSGWQGLLAAVLIGTSLLASAWLPLADTLRAAEERNAVPQWSIGSSAGLLAGIAVLSLSLLYVMPAPLAARIWPWAGVLALWIGLRLSHPALAFAWLALQAGSAAAFLLYGPSLWSARAEGVTLWTPLLIALAGGISGDLLQRAARKASASPVLKDAVMPWLVVGWVLAWWSQSLLPDLWRHLVRTESDWAAPWVTLLIAWVTATSLLATAIARWRGWREMGLSAWVTVPLWICIGFVASHALGPAPHHHFGWLVWPIALVWHVLLLRALPRWCTDSAVKPLHVAGFWLFLVLAALEAQWWTTGWGEPGTAWPMLGWVLVPAATLFAIVRDRVLATWPLTAHRQTYLVTACAPVALYLAAWLWISNTGSGSAAPLAYIPLLNPLEIGHGLVLLALAGWLRALPDGARVPKPVLLWALGATAFALFTGTVLRTCHHWAGVPWDAGALFASKLTQAALSVAWSAVGVALMTLGHKRVRREVWVAGAALLGVVVVKLFFVELADRGGLSRIVSFIVVGLLLLLVGYLAPVPPARKEHDHAA